MLDALQFLISHWAKF